MKGGSGSCDPLSVENRRALSGPRCGAVTKRWLLPLHPPLTMPFPLFFVLESGPNMLPAGRGSSLDMNRRAADTTSLCSERWKDSMAQRKRSGDTRHTRRALLPFTGHPGRTVPPPALPREPEPEPLAQHSRQGSSPAPGVLRQKYSQVFLAYTVCISSSHLEKSRSPARRLPYCSSAWIVSHTWGLIVLRIPIISRTRGAIFAPNDAIGELELS